MVFGIAAQNLTNLELPFQKCSAQFIDNDDIKFVASDNDKTIFVSKDKGKISSIDIEKKQYNWQTEIGGVILPDAFIDGDILFLITKTTNEININRSYLVAVDNFSGIVRWKAEIEDGSYLSFYKNKQSLIILNKNGSITSFNKTTGKIVWQQIDDKYLTSTNKFLTYRDHIARFNERFLTFFSSTDGSIISNIEIESPLTTIYFFGSQNLITGDNVGSLTLKELSSGRLLWKTRVGGYVSFVEETPKGVLVSSFDNFLYLFSKNNGKLVWKKRVNGRITEKPVLVDDYVITSSVGDNVTNIIELKSGKSINQIIIDKDNNFTNEPIITNKYLILQTLKGIYFYSNKCPKE